MSRLAEFIDLARRCYFMYTRSARGNNNVRRVPNGWVQLGSGWFGVALQHKDYPEYVLKISGRSGWGENLPWSVNSGSQLDAWPVFAAHCQAHPHQHLPNILHLERVSESMTRGVMPKYVARYTLEYNWIEEDMIQSIRDMLDTSACSFDWLWPIKQMKSGLDLLVDLHSGNIMHDPVNCTFVITDPFSTVG